MQSTSTMSDFVSAIRGLAPLIADHRQSFDRERRLPEQVFAALAEAGLFRLWFPKSFGGPQLTPLEFMAVVEEAAALDGSVGWLVGNGAGMSRIAGYLGPEVSREVFEDPKTFVVSGTMPNGVATPCDGGYLVSGHWTFGSGSNHANWYMGLCRQAEVDGNANQPMVACYFQAGDVTLVDTWHVSGLKATGSNDFKVEGLFVPDAYSHPQVGGSATVDDVLYRIPWGSIFPWTVSVVPLGIARGAMTAAADIANRKGRQGSDLLLRDRETVQFEMGRCDAVIRAARAFLIDAMKTLMLAVDLGGDALVAAQVRFRLACTHGADSARMVLDSLAAILGAASIFETNLIERCQRDVLAAAKHIAMSHKAYIEGGRAGLGLVPGPRF
ncbi:MAG: alkylation response protein AidB-like acyl-CoA dehydrogenase [Gammaproteobacteria bacterium]|jgi:alkylation response protein AidB-like acyl-CoA dehydrogenase